MSLISDSLYYRGLRDRVVMLWNANNTYGFNRIDWTGLNFATTVTTVSRYMKFRMWEWGQNPIVIPNGISRESIVEADPQVVDDLRRAAGADRRSRDGRAAARLEASRPHQPDELSQRFAGDRRLRLVFRRSRQFRPRAVRPGRARGDGRRRRCGDRRAGRGTRGGVPLRVGAGGR